MVDEYTVDTPLECAFDPDCILAKLKCTSHTKLNLLRFLGCRRLFLVRCGASICVSLPEQDVRSLGCVRWRLFASSATSAERFSGSFTSGAELFASLGVLTLADTRMGQDGV